MSNCGKRLSNPFSTGGGGPHFEAHVQASFVALMLTGGFAPCLPCLPIVKIKLQGKFAGYDTDDLIVFVKKAGADQEQKMLCQIKHSINITEKDPIFAKVIQSAWNDFNNTNIFTKNKDAILLITGPLSVTDIRDVRTILEWARNSENCAEFFSNIERANFSSPGKRKKLKVFQSHLKKANGCKDVPDATVYQFLRHFHLLGYDLDIKAGVTLSLIQSLIGQYSQENAQNYWTRLVEEVQSANKNAGTITLDKLPDDLQAAFKKETYETIPASLSASSAPTAKPDWNRHEYAAALAITNLLGSWNEKSDADIVIAGQLAREKFSTWISKVQEILQQPESPIALKNGIWNVVERKDLWQTLGPRLFDVDLDVFKQCAVAVLTERDPQFELFREKRYAASIYGKVLKHSQYLRKGLAESLALFGSHPGALNHCSLNKPETIAVSAIREIFKDADWKLWGSLNNLLPLLAEAAPAEFLNAVEAALKQNPCPFDELFSQECTGAIGNLNYLTGLLWAMETLAWDEQFLVPVSIILGDLATHDPGGNWANRPFNSLTTIFLPWFPQTTASIEKRRVAIKTLKKEVPDIAWKLLISLLPDEHQISMGSHKPAWRNPIPEDWKKEVTQKEFSEQVSFYADLAVEEVRQNIVKLTEIICHLNNLPKQALKKILEILSSKDVSEKPENERVELWTGLKDFVSIHKRFADAKWGIDPDTVLEIERIAKTLAPKNLINLYNRLFSHRDFDLYEEEGNLQEQGQHLEARRQQAIKDILDCGGVNAVIEFANGVESPPKAGYSLGSIAEDGMDSVILPTLLTTECDNLKRFAGGYVCARQQNQGWVWVEKINVAGWTQAQIGQFLAYLPFTIETWKRANALLGDSEKEYWSRANVNPYQTDCPLEIAIDKLIDYGRPGEAISCLHKILRDKKQLDKKRAVKALIAATSSEELSNSMHLYDIAEIIKALQNAQDTDSDDLFRVEWAYLPLLNRHYPGGVAPKLLETKLASDPNFFCEVIRLIYRSKKAPKPDVELTEQKKNIAINAYRLLSEWRTPPGLRPDGKLSGEQFRHWLETTKKACMESGHLDLALIRIGCVLFYCPPDADGLLIDRTAAEALNDRDAAEMRTGFSQEIINSRGVHWVDPTGKPERELATKYREQAEELENAGYQRLAATLRDLAQFYDLEAERIIAEHKTEAAE